MLIIQRKIGAEFPAVFKNKNTNDMALFFDVPYSSYIEGVVINGAPCDLGSIVHFKENEYEQWERVELVVNSLSAKNLKFPLAVVSSVSGLVVLFLSHCSGVILDLGPDSETGSIYESERYVGEFIEDWPDCINDRFWNRIDITFK